MPCSAAANAFRDPRVPGSATAEAATRVADGTRTRDHRDHNPGLYQLSYRHRAEARIATGQSPPRTAWVCVVRADSPAGGVEEVGLYDDRRLADVERSRARAVTSPSRTAPEEVRLRLDRRRARAGGEVEERAHRSGGVGERHEHASVEDAARGAELRAPTGASPRPPPRRRTCGCRASCRAASARSRPR